MTGVLALSRSGMASRKARSSARLWLLPQSHRVRVKPMFVVTALAGSAFGPYVVGSARTDPLLAYLFALMLVPLCRYSGKPAAVALLWLAYVMVAVLGWAHPPAFPTTSFESGSAFATGNRLLEPVAVLVVVFSVVTPANRRTLLRRVATVTVVGMCLNALISIAQLVVPLNNLLAHWWAGAPGGGDGSAPTSVAALAITNSRFTGIINQPAEAGILYVLAVLCAIYRFADRPNVMVAVLVPLVVGALLTVSKMFLLVGIPICTWHFVRMSQGRGKRIAGAALVLGAVLAAGLCGMLPHYAGAGQLALILPNSDSSPLMAFSAGRYGSGSSLQPALRSVWTDQPLLGYGLPGLRTDYDSAWIEAVVISGLLGAAVLAGVYLAMRRAQLRCAVLVDEPERRLFAGLFFTLAAGSLGLPVLSANRVSCLAWMLLGLLMTATLTDRSQRARR